MRDRSDFGSNALKCLNISAGPMAFTASSCVTVSGEIWRMDFFGPMLSMAASAAILMLSSIDLEIQRALPFRVRLSKLLQTREQWSRRCLET